MMLNSETFISSTVWGNFVADTRSTISSRTFSTIFITHTTHDHSVATTAPETRSGQLRI